MFAWSWKTMLKNPGRLLANALSIASAILLVLFFDSVYRGESTQIVSYISKMKPDLWVMQKGVYNMHMATSYIWDWKADRIRKVPGVKKVTPIIYLNSVVNAGSVKSFSYIVGINPNDQRAGPWKIARGNTISKSGEAVIPDVLSQLSGIGVGDTISIADKTLKVVGLSKGTYSVANAITFIAIDDLMDILSASGTYSYLLVDLDKKANIDKVKQKILSSVDKINVMKQQDFVKSDFKMAMQMGVEIIYIMTIICSVLAVLLIGFNAYSNLVRNRHEIAVIKALGAKNKSILAAVLFQSLILAGIAYGLAVIISYTLFPYVPALAPQVTVVLSSKTVEAFGVTTLIITMLGTLFPAYLALKVDPANAFKS